MQPYNSQTNQQQQKFQLSTINQFFKGIPFCCRFIYFGMFFFWVLNIKTRFPQNNMQSNLLDTFLNYQIWRLGIGFMFQQHLLIVILCILNYQTFLPLLEYKKCSTFLLISFIFQNIVIQLFASILEYLYFLITWQVYICINGAAGVWFYYMTTFCLYNPAVMKFCCFNFKFNRKYFPFIYFGIISLCLRQIRTDMIAGIILALIQSSSIMENRKYYLPMKYYMYIQQILSKTKITEFQCWIRFQPAKYLQLSCTKIMYSNLEQQTNKLLKQNEIQRSSTSTSVMVKNSPSNNSDPFSGKQGVRLDDDY